MSVEVRGVKSAESEVSWIYKLADMDDGNQMNPGPLEKV